MSLGLLYYLFATPLYTAKATLHMTTVTGQELKDDKVVEVVLI